MSDSFCKRLIASFELRADRVAMRIVGDDAEVYTFGESLRMIRSIAYRLHSANVEFGDRVALIGENHPNWAVAYLGTLYRGAVCVPLDPHGEIETIANFIENSEAKIAFLSSDQIERFGRIEERLGRRIDAVVWNDAETGVLNAESNGFQSFSDWSSSEFPDSWANEVPTACGEDIALLIYTSGTTGTPKGVPLTHGNIAFELDGVNDVLKLTDKEKILSLLPLFHAYLQIVNLWVASTYGCEVGYLKELSPAELGEAMKKFRPTILTTVPRLWYLFHKKIFDAVNAKPGYLRRLFRMMLAVNGALRDGFGVNLGRKFFGKVHESFGGRLRLAVSAGSRFDEDVARDFHKLGFTILQGYGLTETSGAATATYENDNRVGSVGKAMRGAEIKIAEPGPDGIGEVLIRGPIVFGGYYRNPEATAEAFTEDGWFRSGDLGRFDMDGHLYIVGRAKDVIVLPSGKNVHPEDIELHYLRSPLVEELAVLGVHDEAEGRSGAEKLAAVIVPDFEYLRHAKIANSKEAIRHDLDNLGRELPEYQRVRDYIIRVEPLPRTATRKIKRFQLKKELESNGSSQEISEKRSWELSDDDRRFIETPVGKAVSTAIRQNSRDADLIHPKMNLEIDLGLDSLARAETFAALEQAFSTEFEAEEAATALTVENVIDMVNRHGGGDATDISIDLDWRRIVQNADSSVPEIQPVLKRRPLFGPIAWAVYRGFNLLCRLLFRLEVDGLENLLSARGSGGRGAPTGGPRSAFIVSPNHQSFLDPFVVCSNYPLSFFRDTFHVGASEFWESRLMRWLARLLHVVPVNPDTELMRAMRAGAAGLKNGKVLNIYPEGERAFDGELHEFKKGAAILATELDLPIVPVALDGLYKVWPRHSWRVRLAKVRVRFGRPFYAREVLQAAGDLPGNEYELVTEHLKNTIAAMIDEMRNQA